MMASTYAYYLLDCQNFEYKSFLKCIPKEVALLCSNNNKIIHKFINFPFNSRIFDAKTLKHIHFVENHLHGIRFDSFDNDGVNLECLKDFLQQHITEKSAVVYVKGLSKKKYFESLLDNPIEDLEIYQCPNLSTLKKNSSSNSHCLMHSNNNLNCSLEHVVLLHNWFKNTFTYYV